mgnify:CR=1 FL=1|tara:strand:- start:615 stop:1700 length:1086 start_codon:yes stop_codon:yes gene_type:complete
MKIYNNPFIEIDRKKIGIDYPPYVIAEMSANHNGSIKNAIKIIDEAKKNGANAVKIQTYSPETITLNVKSDEFKIFGGKWDGQYLYDLYGEAHLPWEWHEELFAYAKKNNITIFSSPFDKTAIDLLEKLNAPAYKIASFEAIDLPLIRYAAKTGKPLIISSGMSNFKEIEESIVAAKEAGCKELAILHCVSSYPSLPEDYNLRTISDLIKKFNLVVGLSDHTLENATAISSVAMGASIIEKHFTLDKNAGGPDDSFSIEPLRMHDLTSDINIAWKSLGKVNYDVLEVENQNIKFRRSLYFIKNLESGSILKNDDFKSVRPGYGLSPKYTDSIIGKKLIKKVKINTPVTEECFENFKVSEIK